MSVFFLDISLSSRLLSFICMSVFIYEGKRNRLFVNHCIFEWESVYVCVLSMCVWVCTRPHITTSPRAISLLYVSDLFFVIIIVLQSEVFLYSFIGPFWCEMRKERMFMRVAIRTKWFCVSLAIDCIPSFLLLCLFSYLCRMYLMILPRCWCLQAKIIVEGSWFAPKLFRRLKMSELSNLKASSVTNTNVLFV